MQITFLKIIDNYLGRFVSCMLRPPLFRQIIEPARFLVIRPGGIGDAVLLIPAIKTLKKAFPACTIDILAERRNAAAFHFVSGIHKVYLYDSLSGLSSVLSNSYDAVIDTEQWYRLSAVVARLIRAPMKVGFDTNERRRMFTHRIGHGIDVYEPDNFTSLLKPLGLDFQRDVGTDTLELPLQPVFKANYLLQQLCSNSFIVIFPGASIPEKRWGAERFRMVAKRLTEDGYKLVVVGGKEDRADGEIIAGVRGVNLAGSTTLTETAAVIARSNLVITGDSGVLHIAVGLDIPTVSLFGPSSVTKWAPRGEKHVVVSRRLSCSPCTKFGMTPPCPIGVRCMNEITADQIVEAAVRLLKKV